MYGYCCRGDKWQGLCLVDRLIACSQFLKVKSGCSMAPKRGSMMAGNQVETGTCLSDVESCNMISIDVSDEIGRASFC